jgi:hypothetical protein
MVVPMRQASKCLPRLSEDDAQHNAAPIAPSRRSMVADAVAQDYDCGYDCGFP